MRQDGVIGKDDFHNFFTEVMELADESCQASPAKKCRKTQSDLSTAKEAKRKEFPSLEECRTFGRAERELPGPWLQDLSALFKRSLLEGESGLSLSVFERLLIRYVQAQR